MQTELRVAVVARREQIKREARSFGNGHYYPRDAPRLRARAATRRSLVPFTLLIESLLGYRGDLSD